MNYSRDRLVFGIRDHKTRERLLRELALTLARHDEICRVVRAVEDSMTRRRKNNAQFFGILSAPEVFPVCIHELNEGLQEVEMVSDDFVVVGFGDTVRAATQDHDSNLKAPSTGVLRRE